MLARYGPKERRYDTVRYHTKYRDTIHYDTIHYDTMRKCNVKFNALQHGRQFVNERLLLLQRLRAWTVHQDDDRSETADTGRA